MIQKLINFFTDKIDINEEISKGKIISDFF